MNRPNVDRSRKRLLAWYNMIPNVIWSIINIGPILIFCLTKVEPKTVYTFLAISFFPVFLSNAFISSLQIGKTTKIYKKPGVHFINRVSQNGDIINKLVKRKFPAHRILNYDKEAISKLIKQTYVF